MELYKDNKGDKVEVKDGKFKSDFYKSAENIKEQLDSVSPSFCLAKWNQVSLHLPTGYNNSCYHPPLHKMDAEAVKVNPSALHNTQHKKEMRKMMINGERPKECQYCWNIEDTGHMSDRHYRSGEPWAHMDFETILNTPWNADKNPRYVEVNFNHNCNLKCSYCSPQFSTSWEKETKQFGAWPTKTPHNAPEHFTGSRACIPHSQYNPYVEAFWKWWPDLYKDLKHFRMTGGEPLMDKNTYKVFDYINANPKSDLHLNVTSNFSVEDKLFDKYIEAIKPICLDEKVEHFMQYISVDSWMEQAEYIRNGLDFNRMWNNINRFLTEIPYRNSVTFIITYNNLSVTGLDKLLSAIHGLRQAYSDTYQRIWFDTPLLRQPAWQSIQLLPESYQMIHDDNVCWMLDNMEDESTRFKGFKDYEVQRMQRDLAWWQEGSKLDEQYVRDCKADFYRFFNEHDKRRGTNFLETFPEMVDWWKDCKRLAQA